MRLPQNTISHVFEEYRDRVTPCLVSACFFRRDSSGLSKGHSLPYWVLDYSISDCGRCRVKKPENEWLLRTPGIGHLYPPGRLYWEDTRGCPMPLISAYILFTGGEKVFLDKYVENCNGFCRIEDRSGKLGELLVQTAGNNPLPDSAGFYSAQASFFQIIALLHGSTPGQNSWERIISAGLETQRNPAVGHELAAAVRQYLEAHFSHSVTLAEIAARMRVSSSTLSHRYKELTGESPLQTLAGVRINHAKVLLLKGERLKDIAAQTGFYDEFHLSKTFKQITGISPREYLRQ